MKFSTPFSFSSTTNSSFDMLNVMSMAWRGKKRKKNVFSFFFRIVWTAIEITLVYNIYGVLSVAHGSHSTDLAKNCFPCWMLNQQSYLFGTRERNLKIAGKKRFTSEWMKNKEYPNDEPSVSSVHISHSNFNLNHVKHFHPFRYLFFRSLIKRLPKLKCWNLAFYNSKHFLFTILMRFKYIWKSRRMFTSALWMLWNSSSSTFSEWSNEMFVNNR